MFSIKDPGSRLARWRLKLEEYDYTIIYKPGKINKNADALSRIKINHFRDCINLHNKISVLVNNDCEDNSQKATVSGNYTGRPPDENKSVNVDENESYDIGSDFDTQITQEYNLFTDLYKSQSVIDYSKIEISNDQLLDKTHKNIITIFRQNKLENLHDQILDDFLEEQTNFNLNEINIFNSKSVKNRKYFVLLLPFDPETVVQRLFYLIYKSKNEFNTTQKYYVENNLELPILEIFSFIFAEQDIKLCICQNIVKEPDKDEIPIILDQYHKGKTNLHRGINETLRRIKLKYNWPGMVKDVENMIKRCETCNKNKICRKNLTSPLVITETPKTAFERINIDIFEYPSKNYALTIRDELTKFTQAYPIKDKSAKSVVNTLLLFFQHYGTPLRIHCDSGREFDCALMKDLCALYEIKLTFSSIGHPQSNGSIERFHATLAEMIRTNQADNPDEHPFSVLPYAVICYNNTKNKTHGFTPYELIFGHTSSRPPDTLYDEKNLITKYIRDLNNRMQYYYKIARNRTEQNKLKSKERFDKHASDKIPEYRVGQKVYFKESHYK